MVKRVVAVAVLVLGLMVVVKDGRVLRSTGLTSMCTNVQTAADGVQLEACRAGKLQGRPDLTRDGCTDAGASGTYEYWRCPAAVAAGPGGH
jgi:hypothetical protein